MKKAELNKIFTAKVTEYLNTGNYTIYTKTMSGSQTGEVTHIDLTDGKKITRIFLGNGHCSLSEEFYSSAEYFTITIGTASLEEAEAGWTIWDDKLDIIEEEVYYCSKYDSDWLVSKEEAIANKEKARSRWEAQGSSYTLTDCTDKATIKALLPYINKQDGCKSVKARHITEVEKQTNSDGSFVYRISIKKKDKIKVELLNSKTLKKMRGAC